MSDLILFFSITEKEGKPEGITNKNTSVDVGYSALIVRLQGPTLVYFLSP